ncbi:hypothetical protein GIB67_039634, partial [Kingdonia uniflora]
SLTMVGVRRLLEEDMKLAISSLDPFIYDVNYQCFMALATVFRDCYSDFQIYANEGEVLHSNLTDDEKESEAEQMKRGDQGIEDELHMNGEDQTIWGDQAEVVEVARDSNILTPSTEKRKVSAQTYGKRAEHLKLPIKSCGMSMPQKGRGKLPTTRGRKIVPTASLRKRLNEKRDDPSHPNYNNPPRVPTKRRKTHSTRVPLRDSSISGSLPRVSVTPEEESSSVFDSQGESAEDFREEDAGTPETQSSTDCVPYVEGKDLPSTEVQQEENLHNPTVEQQKTATTEEVLPERNSEQEAGENCPRDPYLLTSFATHRAKALVLGQGVWRLALKGAIEGGDFEDPEDPTYEELGRQFMKLLTIAQEGPKGEYEDDIILSGRGSIKK